MSPSNIALGLIVVVVGIYAIVLNKYPGKQVSFENAKRKYPSVNERRLTLLDGGFCIVYGAAYMMLGTLYLAILLLAYYPVRIVLLKLRFL